MTDKTELYKALLTDAAACFELQAATAREWAKMRDREANLGLAAEYDRHARVIRSALANH